MVLERDLLRATRHGGIGAFEALSSGAALVGAARDLLDNSDLASRLRMTGEVPNPRAILDSAAAGDGLASEIVARLVDHVAMAIIAISTVADPEIVILEGGVGRALGGWVPGLKALMELHLPAPPDIVVSSLDGEATAIGVVASALDLSRAQRGPHRSPPIRGALSEPRQAARARDGLVSSTPPAMVGSTARALGEGPRPSRVGDFMGRYAISVVFFILLVGLLIASPDFRDPRNLWNVLQQNSIIGIVARACW